jgi:NAD(P)-dependent dehydrogenase (short-subunit alcohol dehydrogenase family)
MSRSSTPFALHGRVVAITGGNRDIGRCIALGMARAGASVAILARDHAKNSEVLSELHALGAPAWRCNST